MNTIEKVTCWGDTHHPKWMDIVRMGLGMIIFYKGVEFGRNPQDLHTLLEGSNIALWTFLIAHYIAISHIGGGILIMLGLLTRPAIMFQMPILIGAVIFTGRSIGVFDIYSGFGLSALVLGLLIIFLIYGSGPFSADEYLRKHPDV